MNPPVDNKPQFSRRNFDLEIDLVIDRFFVIYALGLGTYLFIAALIFLPVLNPAAGFAPMLRITPLTFAICYHAVVPLAVLGVAMRIKRAPVYYRRAVKSFLTVLAITSVWTFGALNGFAAGVFITIALGLVLLPYIIILLYGFRYLKRPEVMDSFQSYAVR